MNEIVLADIGSQITADSRNVAFHFEKRHSDVMRAIEDLLGKTSTEFCADLFVAQNGLDSYGRSQKYYLMNRDGFTLLAMGFTGVNAVHWKIKYIEAFNKMEKALSHALPKTFAEALRLAADQAEKIEKQESYIKALEPKAEFFDAVAGSKEAISIADTAKVLNMGVGQNKLFEVLRREKILQDDNMPYQTCIDRGYFRTVEQKYVVRGETRISIKTLVMQKGVDYIRRLLQKRAVRS